MNDYEKLLENAKKNLPEINKQGVRFEIPVVVVEHSGRQTIVKNFIGAAKILRRSPEHIAKFLFKELAAPGNIKDSDLMLLGKINKDIINRRIEEYAKEFVLCNECGKPDTKIEKSDKIYIINVNP